MSTLDANTFDRTRPLALARFGTLKGHVLHAGDPVRIVEEPDKPGEVTDDEAVHLWTASRIVYAEDARPTPVETPARAADRLTEMEPLGDDKFLIRAPWLGRGETVTGAEAAAKRRAEVIDAGVSLYSRTADAAGGAAAAAALGGDAFTMTETGSNGYYEITGPGLDEPERVRGKANAEARLIELRGDAAQQPAGDAEA